MKLLQSKKNYGNNIIYGRFYRKLGEGDNQDIGEVPGARTS